MQIPYLYDKGIENQNFLLRQIWFLDQTIGQEKLRSNMPPLSKDCKKVLHLCFGLNWADTIVNWCHETSTYDVKILKIVNRIITRVQNVRSHT